MDDFWADLRVAVRRILRRPGYSLPIVLALGLGIGANTAVYSFIDALLVRPLPYAEADRLVRIQSVRGETAGKVSALDVQDLRERSQLLEGIASYRETQYTMTSAGAPEALAAVMSSHNLFDVLGVRPLYGRTWPASDDRTRQFAVVLSHHAWERIGSDPSIIGNTVILDGTGYTVLGVMPPGFNFPANVDIFRRVPAQDFVLRSIRSTGAAARMKPGVSLVQLQEELNAISTQLELEFPDTNRGLRFEAAPLRTQWLGDARPFLLLLAGAVGFVLLLACSNAANLILAETLRRGREFALRVAIGGSRVSLVRGVLLEVFVLAAAAGAAGLAIGWTCTRALDTMIRAERPAWMALSLDTRVVVVTSLAALIAALVSGLLPALHVARAAPASGLRYDARAGAGGRGRRRLRSYLVATQVALALILLAGAGLLTRSLMRIHDVELGLRPDGVLTLQIDPPWTRFNTATQTAPLYRRMLDELRSLPGVEAAASVEPLPFSGATPEDAAHRNVPVVEGRATEEQERAPFVNLLMVSPGYFETMGIPLINGRPFDEHDALGAPPVALVSRRAADALFPGQDAIGKRLRLGEMDANYRPGVSEQDLDPGWITIVGVVGDVRQGGIDEPPGMDLYVSAEQVFTPETFLAIRSRGRPEALLDDVRQAIWRVDATQAIFDVRSMRGRLDDAIWQRRLATMLLAGFSLLALLIASLGVYAVAAFAVSERTAEIGLRMAVGAQRVDIARLVIVEAGRLITVGVVAGLAAALALGRLASSLLYRVGAADPVALSSAAAVLAIVALLASYIPARRAARLEPVTALRSE